VSYITKYEEATALEKRAEQLRREACLEKLEELRAIPIFDRLVFAAVDRCRCGAGMAYDPAGDSGKPITGYWACSKILLGEAWAGEAHHRYYPFTAFELRSEHQPTAKGATTRPKQADKGPK